MGHTFRFNIYRKGCYVEEWGDPDYYYDCTTSVLKRIIDTLDMCEEADLIKTFAFLNKSNIITLYKTGYEKHHIDFYTEPIYLEPDMYFIEIVP